MYSSSSRILSSDEYILSSSISEAFSVCNFFLSYKALDIKNINEEQSIISKIYFKYLCIIGTSSSNIPTLKLYISLTLLECNIYE